MAIEHRAVLRDDDGRRGIFGTREGQSIQGMILLEETTIPNEVAQQAIH